MKNYNVYFDVLGKKFRTRMSAENIETAISKVRENVAKNIVFDKIEVGSNDNEFSNEAKDVMDLLDEFTRGFKK